MNQLSHKLNFLFLMAMTLAVLAGWFLTQIEWLAKHGRWPEAWLDSPLLTPAFHFEKAADSIAIGQVEAAQTAMNWGLRAAPYWGPAWALQGYIVEQRYGVAVALPFYEQALMLDRFGRKTTELALPPLWRAGWLDTSTLLQRALRLDSETLARLLPEQPPADWPLAYKKLLDTAAAQVLYQAGRDQWLLVLERQGLSADYGPAQRAAVLAGVCRIEPTQCLALLAACEVGNPPCRKGVQITGRLILHASEAALTVGDYATAIRWARRALNTAPDPDLIGHVVRVLERAGDAEEARRLRRLHPALYKSRSEFD